MNARYLFIRFKDISKTMLDASLHRDLTELKKFTKSGWTIFETDYPYHSLFRHYEPMQSEEAIIRWNRYCKKGWLVRQITVP